MATSLRPGGAEREASADNKQLTIRDHRTNRDYDVPIEHGAISAMSLRGIKVDDDDFGLMSYDPAYKNTASTKSGASSPKCPPSPPIPSATARVSRMSIRTMT